MNELILAIALICSTNGTSTMIRGWGDQATRSECVFKYTKCLTTRQSYGNNVDKLQFCAKQFVEEDKQ